VRFDLDPGELEVTYASPPSRFVEAGGIRFHVRDRGQGAAVVLVHGQSANLFVWEGWAERLAQHYRVVSLDLPGHGLTGPDPRGGYLWPELAASLSALIEELDLGRFVLVGNSLGGAVSLEYALREPNRLAGLVLVDTIGPPRPEPRPLIFEAYATPVLGNALAHLTPRWLVRANRADTYGPTSKFSNEGVERFQAMMRRAGNRRAAREIVAQAFDPSIPRWIGSISTPTLVLWGAEDTWTPVRDAAWLGERLPNAEVHILPGLGHMPMAEDPEGTLPPMRAFLARIFGRPGGA